MTLLWLFRKVESPAKTSLNWVLVVGATVNVTEPVASVVPVLTTVQRGFLPVLLSRVIVAPATPVCSSRSTPVIASAWCLACAIGLFLIDRAVASSGVWWPAALAAGAVGLPPPGSETAPAAAATNQGRQ